MATSSSLQQFKEFGESTGLTGAELVEFVKEQQASERADRQAEREAKEKESEEKEKDREHREKEMKFHQAEAAKRRQKSLRE